MTLQEIRLKLNTEAMNEMYGSVSIISYISRGRQDFISGAVFVNGNYQGEVLTKIFNKEVVTES